MAPNPSLLPVRLGRIGASGLPRPATVFSSSRPPPPAIIAGAVEDHQPVASTSKLPPPPPTPATPEHELSRLDWEDLLADRNDQSDDLLNDESASWLVDQSAYTIAARTPARARTVVQRKEKVPLDAPEEGDEELCPLPEIVVHPLETQKAATEKTCPTDMRAETATDSRDRPSNTSNRSRSATPGKSNDYALVASRSPRASVSALEQGGPGASGDRKVVLEEDKLAGNIVTGSPPPPAASTSPQPRELRVASTASENGQDTSPVAVPHRHRPSLAPLPRPDAPQGSSIPETAATSPPVTIPLPPSSSLPSTSAAATGLQPAEWGSDVEAAELDVKTEEKEATAHADTPSPSEVPRSPPAPVPTARARMPRASLAVMTDAPVRPAHILPADHPSHPRLRPPMSAIAPSTAAVTSSTKGVRAPDEEARKKVREAKEAREKSAKERKDKAEKAAAALREAAKKEKGRAGEIARAAAATIAHNETARRSQPKTEARPPLRATSTVCTTGPVPQQPAVAKASPAESMASCAPSETCPGPRPTEAERQHREPSPLVPPIVVIEAGELSHHEISRQFDPNVTLPDMGAPLDFGPVTAGLKGGTTSAASATSTPARHLKRKDPAEDARDVQQEDIVAPREQKRPRRISQPYALPPASTRTMEAIQEAEEDRSGRQAGSSLPAAPTTTWTSKSSSLSQTHRRRASRASHAGRQAASGSGDGSLAPTDSLRESARDGVAARSRIVRVTLVAPAPLLRPALQSGTTASTRESSSPARSLEPLRVDLPVSAFDNAPVPSKRDTAEAAAAEDQQAGDMRKAPIRRRRASRVSICVDTAGVNDVARTVSDATLTGSAPEDVAPVRSSAARVPVVASSAPRASIPVTVQLPPRPKVKPAAVIGGITLPATFSFAEPSEESEAERERRLQEKERRERTAEQVLAEKKRLRESASAWAVRPDETAKLPRLLESSSGASRVEANTDIGPAAVARPPCRADERPASATSPRLYRPPRRSVAHISQRALDSASSETSTALDVPPAAPSLALTKEALERNSRKAGPRPDLQRRVSRFLEEISEAEEPLEDQTLSQDAGPDCMQRSKTPLEAQVPAPTHPDQAARAATSPVERTLLGSSASAAPSCATVRPRPDPPASGPAEAPLPPATSTLTATARSTATQPKLVDRSRNESGSYRRVAPDDKVAPMPTKKARREPAAPLTTTVAPVAAASTRPRGKENGVAQGGVASELEKRLQARLEWSERQKKREEDAKQFRQRQRDEEAAREREKLLQFRSSLNQARPKPVAAAIASRKVGRT
ncbi:hypothetical protein JCM3774_003132 [Rhodotorula dairenensis]